MSADSKASRGEKSALTEKSIDRDKSTPTILSCIIVSRAPVSTRGQKFAGPRGSDTVNRMLVNEDDRIEKSDGRIIAPIDVINTRAAPP